MQLNNEIAEELKQLSPYVASLPRRHPFTAPENYFEWLEQHIVKTAIGVKVSSIANDALPEITHPFEVPENYFDELPAKIISLIREHESEEVTHKVFPLRRRFFPVKVWLAAASIAVLLMTTYILWNQQQSPNLSSQQTNITSNGDTDADYEEGEQLQNAVSIDEGMVVDLLLQDQLATDNSVNADNYYLPSLIDVSDMDDELIDKI